MRLLVLPALLLVTVVVLAPVAFVAYWSLADPEMSTHLPRTAVALREWNGLEPVPARVVTILAEELSAAHQAQTLGQVGRRLNVEIGGFRPLLQKTARDLGAAPAVSSLAELARIDSRWSDLAYWQALRRAAAPVTPDYLLAVFDLRSDGHGGIVQVAPERAIFLDILTRTFGLSLAVTVLCVVGAFPVAWWMATATRRWRAVLLAILLLPFWTSVLVRTVAWVVLLQSQGLVNDFGLWSGLWTQRVQLIHNRFGVMVAMVHILLPFVVFPLYSVMVGIPANVLKAARSLGASSLQTFGRVYLPLVAPGLIGGAILAFVLALGFYVTPALVGGPGDQFVAYFIAYYANEELNWGMSGALSVVLLATTFVILIVLHVVVGLDRVRIHQ